MERVYLLVEDTTHRQLPCLLNPETLVQRRLAGVQRRRSATGWLTGAGLADDPLLYTGGGYTELELDLLFDVALSDLGRLPKDVRTQTEPLWRLAENATEGQYRGRPPLVRFLWGKAWNFPGVVVAVAERLDMFTAEGVPQRSWLRLRLVRSQAPEARVAVARPRLSAARLASMADGISLAPGVTIQQHRVVGPGGAEDRLTPVRSVPPVSEAVRTAADIVLSSIAATPAGQLVKAAERQLKGIIGALDESIRRWSTPLREAVQAGVDRLKKALETRASAAKERLVHAATAVAAQVSLAVRDMKAALKKVIDPGEKKDIAGALEPLLERLPLVAESLRKAATVVREAVLGQVRRIVAGVVSYADTGLKEINKVLRYVREVTSDAGDKAGKAIGKSKAAIKAEIEAIKKALDKVKDAGTWVAMEEVGPRLDTIATAADQLWSAGKLKACRAVSSILVGMGVAFRNIREAGEAARLALSEVAAEALTAVVADLRSALKRMEDGDLEALALIPGRWAELELRVEELPAPKNPALQEVVTSAREAIQAIREAPPGLIDTGKVSAALTEVEDAAKPLAAAEGAVTPAVAELRSALKRMEDGDLEALALIPGRWAELELRVEELPDPKNPALQEAVTSAREAIQAIREALPGLIDAGKVSAALTEVEDAAKPLAAAEGVVQKAAAKAPEEERVPRPEAPRERLDQVAFRHYGDPSYWRVLAVFNGIDDPLHLPAGLVLRVPPAALASEGA